MRPKKTKAKESTPEWRKRLVNGEVPNGEQRDLFAPIGLESVFKPPTPRTQGSQQDEIPMMRDSDDLWNFEDDEHREGASVDNASGSTKGKEPMSKRAKRASGTAKSTTTSRSGSQQGSLKVKKGAEGRQQNDQSLNDTQLRTASGLEDLRNEGITPITFSQTNTLDGNGTSEIIKSALKRVTDQLEHLSLSPGERPGSRASDSALLEPQGEELVNEISPEDDLLDVTSNSLPQDLSMGTLDHTGRLAFTKFRRTGYLNDGTLLKNRLTPSPLPSQRLSPGTFGNSRIRSSPPVFLKTNPLTDPPTLPRPSSARSRHSLRDRRSRGRDEGMPSSGSPLKLFGDHDTFTNNKLLRRMSQFEETFGGSDEDEPLSPSEEARRKGENRSFLNVKHDRSSLYSSRRSKTRGSVNPKLNQFGDGGLDNFDFSDTSPYEPKLLYNEIPESEYRPSSERLSSERRQFRSSQNSNNSEYDRTGLAEDNSFGFVEVKPSSAVPEREKNPKRRRTLLRSVSPESQSGQDTDLPEQTDQLSLLQRSLKQHGIDETDAKFLAQPRSVQRPRSPTPSQNRVSTRKRSSSHRDVSKSGSNAPADGKTPPEMEVPRVKVTGVNDERRKGSITTQDYLSEATRIMDMIRSKGKSPGAGLPSLEEIDLEEDDQDEEEDDNDDDKSYDEESTRDEFSRPPSREGIDLRKLREPSKEPNPRILSHLKKFQENDDPEFGVSASIASLRLSHGHQGSFRHADPGPTSAAARKQSLGSLADCDSLEDLLANTQLSSTGIPTGSSQGSHAKGVLSSDMVSHLIPEQVNGFTYDRSRKQWVKEKVRPSSGKPKGEESEDDPFMDIPDLSVDELQEMVKIQSSSSPTKPADFTLNEDGHDDHKSSQPATRTTAPSVIASTLQSRLSRLTSDEPGSGTRATSWDTQERQQNKEPSSEVEHEIQLHKGRLSKPPRKQQDSNQQARVVTISFSSPLVSQVAYSDDNTPTKYTRNEKDVDDDHHDEQPGESPTIPGPQDSGEDELSGKQSIPDIDEEDGEDGEDETGDLRVTRQDNSHLAVSTPFNGEQYNSLAHLRAGEHDTSYSFHLSPLPDFTVNEIDQPLQLELSYVAQRTHPTSLREVHGTFALATEDLVKRITEVEPFEPYWEHVRRLILRDKGLITLNKLNEFCPRLEDLDVSDNHIGHLSGVPASLRTLRIQRNFLSNLTAWGHLVNLQYLDVSGNGLESLDGFNGLIHLREIKANDNHIRNIDGIMELNGLLSLKLSNNALKEVDFTGTEL